jgi:hypothetical protein
VTGREAAAGVVADVLRGHLTGFGPERMAQAVLDDLAAAGFSVVETWRVDRDVLVEAFVRNPVSRFGGPHSPFELWSEPSPAEAERMADVVLGQLGAEEVTS